MGASAPPLEETDSTELIENEEPEREEGYFTRFLEFFYKSDDDDDDEDLSSVKPVSFLELFRFASESELAVIGIACLLSIVSGMCSPAHIYLSGVLTTLYVDVQEPEGDLEFLHLIWSLSSLYGVFFVFTFAVGYVENWLYAWASERIAQRVRSEFIASVLARDAFNDDEASSGELSNRLSSTVDRLKDGIGDNIGTFVRSGSMFFCGSIVSFYLDWKTSLILVWSGPITLVCSTLIPMLSTSDNAKVVDLSEEANGISEEAILNIKTVASCNGEKIMIERYSSSLYSAIAPATRCGFVTALCDASASLLHTLFHVAGTWYGAISYHNGRIEGAGAVFSVVSLAMDSSSSFAQLGSHIMSVIKARAAAAKVYHTIDSSPQEKEDVTEKLDPTQAEMRIGFEDVCYTFPTRSQPVLQNLSFDLAPGKSLALVGQSGCGKSTTLKLLTRFLSADSGRVLLDGLPLERYDKKQWRKQLHLFRMVGVVSQEPSVFNGTIRDNICLGRPFSDEEVTEACRVAYAHEFIMGLEEGYSTLLGPCGVSLSGGQKQRIAIARAIVSNPRLLLLDEATSALDTQSQKTVQEALDAASIGRTTIVVAHRLSTIKNVDRVIVMEEGAIVESSGYDELRTRPDGIFARMVAAQEIEQSDEEAMGPAKMRRKSSESDGDDDDDEEEQEEDSDASSIETIEEETDNDDFPKTRGGVLKLYFFNKTRALLTTALSLLRGVEMPLLGLSYYYVFSSLTDDEYETELFYTMIGTLALGVYSFFIIILSQTLHTYTGESTMVDFRIACFSSLVRRPMAYFDRKETSAASSSVLLSQQPPVAMALVHNSMSNMIENVFAGCAIAVVTFLICIPNGFTGLAYLTIFFSTFYFVEKYSDKAYNEVVEMDDSEELAMEIFDNVSTIQQLGVESHFQNRFDEIQMRTKKPLATKIKCMSMVHAINESECMLLDCMATTIGIWFVYQGWIGIKELYATEFCISILGYCAVSMSDSFKARSPPEIIQAKSAARLLFKLIDPTRQEQEGETGLEFYALMSFNPWILSAKIIIPLEALLGIAVNITLLVFLFRSDIGKAARLYRIACMITAALGCYTSLLLLIVQDVPILVNGSVAVVLYGQALFYLPDAVTDLLVVAFVCQCHTMWQTIPAPSIVQWMSLARPESSSIRRLTQAYSIPLLFHANTWYFVRYLIPDPMLRSELVKSIHDLHGTDSSEFHMYGARMIDKGRIDLLDMMLFNAMPSYLACYGLFFFAAIQIRSRLRQKGSTVSPKTVQMQRRFFRTQIAQVLLPLVLLSPPLLLLTAATFFGTNLANLSFLFIYAFWLSPSATGSLLLAFVVTTARKRAVKPIPQSSSKISPIRKATSNSSTS